MSHALAALFGVAIAYGSIFALIWWNERQWDRHDRYWDGEDG